MASPVLSQRTYRLSHIPDGAIAEDIYQLFPLFTRSSIQHLSLARASDYRSSRHQTSTVTFGTEPSALTSLPYKHGNLVSALIPHVKKEFSRVWIDTHFHGFTIFNDVEDESTVVEYVLFYEIWI